MPRPFVSDAQREKWRQLVADGKVSREQFDAREEETGGRRLPERAPPRVRTVGPSRSTDAAKLGNTRY